VYLHGLGPALQVIDAVFVHRSFRRIWPAALTLIAVVSAYIAWAELFVQRFNDSPAGSVTSGLPYRFLNNLELGGRAEFYVTNLVVAVVLLLIYTGLTWAVRRWIPSPIAP
jgi:small-conductance mechanosensitive channel